MMNHEAVIFSDILLTDTANLQKEGYYWDPEQATLRCIVLAHIDTVVAG